VQTLFAGISDREWKITGAGIQTTPEPSAVMNLKIICFWYVTPCSLVKFYRVSEKYFTSLSVREWDGTSGNQAEEILLPSSG
jgi:hypothetical protein